MDWRFGSRPQSYPRAHMMKIAMHNWMRAEPIEMTIERLAHLGFDQIEISGEPEKHDTGSIRKLLDRHGMTCFGAVTLMLEQRNLLAKDPEQRRQSIQYVKDCARMVHELGGRELTVVPGTVGKLIPDASPEQEWEWAVAALKEIDAFAEPLGVQLAIEPINRFETYFINRGAQALALAEAVGPRCGVCLDIFHMNIEEDHLTRAIESIGDRLINFHVSDSNRMAPGQGLIDWKMILETLHKMRYRGPLSVEFSPPVDRTPANRYPNSIDHDPQGLSDEQKKFLEDHGSSALSEEWFSWLTKQSIDFLRQELQALGA